MTVTQEIELIDSLYVKLDNAFSMHDAMEKTDLYNDIVTVKTDVFLTLIRSYSSGRILRPLSAATNTAIQTRQRKKLLILS